MSFNGGASLAALNAVAGSFDGDWQAGYSKEENGQHRLIVVLCTTEGGVTLLSSRLIKLR
jgi:hypothetical protein